MFASGSKCGCTEVTRLMEENRYGGARKVNELETRFHSFAKLNDVTVCRCPGNEPQLGVVGDHYRE